MNDFTDTVELPQLTSTKGPPAGTPAAGVISRVLKASLIPDSKIGRRLALIAAIDACGTGMFLTGSALYFTRVIGLTTDQVGLGLTLAGLVGFVLLIPVGMLADRAQAGRVYIGLQIWRGIWYLAYCAVGTFPAFAVVACCIGIADNAVPPVNQAVVGAAVPAETRVETLAKVRAVRNAGFGVGALVATVAIQQGTREAFVALAVGNALSFFFAAVLLRAAGITRLTAAAPRMGQPRLGTNLNYLMAALLCGVLTINMTLLTVGMPLWIATRTQVPVVTIGFLVVINTAMAVFLQARFAAPAAHLRGARQSMVWSGLALAAFGVVAAVLAYIASVWLGVLLAIVATVLLTCAELWSAAGRWTISYDLARPEQRAQYLSTFQLGMALQSILGPWVIVQLVFPTRGGWLLFGAATIVAGLLVPSVARKVPRHRASTGNLITQFTVLNREDQP
jgi:MFS family permease